jgi:hypothetical protein
LIDTLQNNQELQITLQEIEIAKMKLELERFLLPTVGLRAGSVEKKWGGTLVKVLGMLLPKLRQEEKFPDPLTDFTIGAYATYEVDIWHKLHTKKSGSDTL